jgi:type IV fimbrial biogenesis protein FimT
MLRDFHNTKSSGFTIIELMVTVAVMSILMMIALPSFNAMMKSAQVRNAAEAVSNGLQKARGEAIARNKNVEFVLGASDTSWTVKLAGGADIEARAASEGSKNVTRATTPNSATKVTFNNFGNVVANADASAQLTGVTTSITGIHSLQVNIGTGGKIKMCDPYLTAGSSPRAC